MPKEPHGYGSAVPLLLSGCIIQSDATKSRGTKKQIKTTRLQLKDQEEKSKDQSGEGGKASVWRKRTRRVWTGIRREKRRLKGYEKTQTNAKEKEGF